jgi:hypothetical protein
MGQLFYTIHLPFPTSVNLNLRPVLRHRRSGSQLGMLRSQAYRDWIKHADDMWLTQKIGMRPVTLGHHRVHVILDARRRRADGHNLSFKGIMDWLQRVEIIHNDADTDFWSGEWGRSDGCTVQITGIPYGEAHISPQPQHRRQQPVRQSRAAGGRC